MVVCVSGQDMQREEKTYIATIPKSAEKDILRIIEGRNPDEKIFKNSAWLYVWTQISQNMRKPDTKKSRAT